MTFHVPEAWRVRTGAFASDKRDGNNGAFFVPNRRDRRSAPLKIIASDGAGWEHVSVSLPDRCPTWPELCDVKALFWDAYDCVVQYHPADSEYVNNHRYCLHLWRCVGESFPVPPSILVGFKTLRPDDIEAMSSEQRLALYDEAQRRV